LCGYLGKVERGAIGCQLVKVGLVSELNPPSLLPFLACFPRCLGYQTENVVGLLWEDLYGCQESREHIFFRCSFSHRIWTKLTQSNSIFQYSSNPKAYSKWNNQPCFFFYYYYFMFFPYVHSYFI
jgi:hypothetical protein